MKKLLLIPLIFTLILTLVACASGIKVEFILNDETLETRTLDEPGIIYGLPNPSEDNVFFTGWYTDPTFEHRYDIMNVVEQDITLYGQTIEVTPGEDNLYFTEQLTMPDYQGRSFLEDGIGAVELFACRDGDTADFIEGDTIFRSRFLALDTPESGHVYEPWGLSASNHACERMRNADTIVLEFDEAAGNRTGNFGRYLAFVWVDGTLLNLELIEMGYGPAQGASLYKYGTELNMASQKAQFTNLRFFDDDGDPDFPYDATAEDVTIQTLIEQPDAYKLKPVNIEGVVTARIAQHVFIQDPETNHGIFFFAHYNTHDSRLSIGNHVRIENAQFYADGKPLQSHFITDYSNATITVLEQDHTIFYDDTALDALTPELSGQVKQVNALTITDFNFPEQSFQATDEHGNAITAYQMGATYIDSDLVPSTWMADLETLSIGDTISFTGVISERRDHGMVLLLTGPDNFTVHD